MPTYRSGSNPWIAFFNAINRDKNPLHSPVAFGKTKGNSLEHFCRRGKFRWLGADQGHAGICRWPPQAASPSRGSVHGKGRSQGLGAKALRSWSTQVQAEG